MCSSDLCSGSRAAYGIAQHPGHRSRRIVVAAVYAQRLNAGRGRRLRVCPADANAGRGKGGSPNPLESTTRIAHNSPLVEAIWPERRMRSELRAAFSIEFRPVPSLEEAEVH